MITLKEYRDETLNRLQSRFPKAEASALTRIVLEDLAHYTPVDVALHKDTEIPPSLVEKTRKMVERICEGEPVQYVLGSTLFFGGRIKVTPDVLIPRPETEQLVDIIADRWRRKSDLHVLDICTGSGCIAVALASVLPFARVEATDISQKAIEVARQNAEAWHVKVEFTCDDALHTKLIPEPKYDIIVSNPPYICRSEAKDMEPVVLDYEPHLALFVPDADPLEFYNPIASFAAEALAPAGALYFEINPLYCDDIVRMLSGKGFVDVLAVNDIHSRKRFIIAFKPND
ncbi:MAG: peptide chain release factor N(5)-glutamine methyltransferase [Muribaculum sp.]|nr:peptide chain release factor N(5)-glutamine methyltransferase [Muribaculaceae bacterium]MCM1081676.1 peptide chain release factor N(5)-glutamine methyltransferase [Muribaculum sp.]